MPTSRFQETIEMAQGVFGQDDGTTTDIVISYVQTLCANHLSWQLPRFPSLGRQGPEA